MEELSGGHLAKKLIYKRYIKFITSLVDSDRPMLRALFQLVRHDVQSVTGSNLHKILLDTGVNVVPGVRTSSNISWYNVYGGIPNGKEWIIPMLTDLIEVRDNRWEVNFDSETDGLTKDDIDVMINDICSS